VDSPIKIKNIVKQNYGKIALSKTSCCVTGSCCSSADVAKNAGYTAEELAKLDDANLGLGCGNPTALSSLKAGEIVLDLGSGGGIDCLIAAKKVGNSGRVIGIDMTPEMIQLAKENAKKLNFQNVEFILGDIERIPVEDNTVDVVISNCVINLSLNKEQVFKEIYRVLKNSGRMAISDIVLNGTLPEEIKNSELAYIGCIAGAVQKEYYISLIYNTGFHDVTIVKECAYNTIYESKELKVDDVHVSNFKNYSDVIKSISIVAWK